MIYNDELLYLGIQTCVPEFRLVTVGKVTSQKSNSEGRNQNLDIK